VNKISKGFRFWP